VMAAILVEPQSMDRHRTQQPTKREIGNFGQRITSNHCGEVQREPRKNLRSDAYRKAQPHWGMEMI
jgi:hypothetical protein